MTSTPTQVRRPWRATLRSAVQFAIPTILTLGIVVPEIIAIVLDEVGETMPDGLRAVLLAVSAVMVAAAAIVARIMAIPAVEAFLKRHLSFLAAEPPATGERRAETGAGELRLALIILGAIVAAWLLIAFLRTL